MLAVYNFIILLFKKFVNSFITGSVITEIVPFNPMERIEKVKKDVFIPEFYTDEELINLINVIKTQKLELPLTLGIIYDLRREEILGLTWHAIDFNNKSITIRKTVGRGKYEGITQFLIKDIPKNKSSYRTFSRILDENAFRHIRLHDLRNSCATLLLRNGVPLPEIQKWLGHSNIITTQRYSHLNQNDKSIPAKYD